jgi:Domain of unknown function (DUF4253)
MTTAQALESAIGMGGFSEYFVTPEGAIYSAEVPASESAAAWRRSRESARGLGYWPVIFGGQKDANNFKMLLTSPNRVPAAQILEDSAKLDATAVLAARFKKSRQLREDRAHGPWPGAPVPSAQFHLPTRSSKSDDPDPLITIGLVPTDDPCVVPAVTGFGGWNECPKASEHVALHRHWQRTYGAELACMSRDIIEMSAGRRPSTQKEAIALATEQFLYCPDIVEQGTRTIETLAACLMASELWFFWWD